MHHTLLRSILLTSALLFGARTHVDAQDVVPTMADEAFEEIKPKPAPANSVQQAVYSGLPIGVVPATTTAVVPASAVIMAPTNTVTYGPSPQAPPPAAVYAGPVLPAPGPVQSPQYDGWVLPPQPPPRTTSWTAGIELLPLNSELTDGKFERWTDDTAVGIRLLVGFEDPRGFGLRARAFGLSQDASPDFGEATLNLSSFNFDLYKRLFFADRTELAIGFGGASGVVEFEVDDDNTRSEFRGGGVTVFTDGFVPIVAFDRADLGAVGRARYSLLTGEWRDNTGFLVAPTENDTMAIVELAWGIEYRRRFGPCEDHLWYVAVLGEYQRWQSDWMSNLTGTSIGLAGVNINTGLVW